MEVARVIVDTDVLIDLLRNVEKVVNFLVEMEEKKMTLSTTLINSFELYHGAHKSKRREENVPATRKLLNRMILLTISPKSAEIAGRMYAELEEKGQPIGLRDALIGAISLTRGYPIVTGNVEHFRRIPGLSLIQAP